jgi:predicted GNAT family acetyltransferase/glutaredoxin
VADGVLTLWQAEWCPFSSAVREVLTELGVDFVARQVEPWPEQRERLQALAGTDSIPVLIGDDGGIYRGTREIFAYLRSMHPWEYAAMHRRRFADHQPARESNAAGQLIEYFRGADQLEAAEGSVEDSVVVDAPEASRYELRLGGTLIGISAYHRRGDRIAFTHTEVDEEHEGRGFASHLARGALDDARRQGLQVVPLCPYIAAYIQRHPEYEDLVAPGYRERSESVDGTK